MNEYIDKIRDLLNENNIRYYCVFLVNSGFGDIITNASAQSYICDQFGLKFKAIANKDFNLSFAEWYESIFKDIGFDTYNSLDRLLTIEIDSILENLDIIYKELVNCIKLKRVGGGNMYDAICIKPKNLFFTQSFDILIENTNTSFYDNQFVSIFRDKIHAYMNEKYNFKRRNDTFNIVLHLRTGDCARFLANKDKDIIATDWFSRGVHSHSWFNLQTKEGYKGVYNDYKIADNMISFAKEMHLRYGSKVFITFITEGFSKNFWEKVNSLNFSKELKKLNKKLDIRIVENYINNETNKWINNDSFDKIIIGDSKEIFFETISEILNANLTISSARSFIFRILMGWKKDMNLPQIVYLKSLEKTGDMHLLHRNVKVFKFIDFESILLNTNSIFDIYNFIYDQNRKNEKELAKAKKKIFELENKIKELDNKYKQSLKTKEYLSYKLGKEFVKAHKNWYKGGYIKFIFKAIKIKEEYKHK